MRFQIGHLGVGDDERCFVIAEAGSNHDGRLDQAKQLMDVAAKAGADAVKFQTFRADRLYPRTDTRVGYLDTLGVHKPIYELIRELEMPLDWLPELASRCREHGLIFLSTPFDEDMADAIDPFVPAFKIASYELTHIPLIRHVARKHKPMILSTGGASLEEIVESVAAVRAEGNDQVCVLQCTAKYPAPLETIDVRALDVLRAALGVPVGLSDHSIHPHLRSRRRRRPGGAAVIEKHFTLDRGLPGPDHSYAIEPDELRQMVEAVRGVEAALGQSEKSIRHVEAELILRTHRRTVAPVAEASLMA